MLSIADPENIGHDWILERPKVFYNARTKKFVMYMHLDGHGYSMARVAIAVSDKVDGNYTYVKSFRPLGHESRDIGQFIDDDGSAYLIFAYVYFFRSKGLLHGLAAGTNWVFRDESCHLEFAFEVVNVVRAQEPDLWDEELEKEIVVMLHEAVDAEAQFAEDLLSGVVAGLSLRDMRQYLGYVADSRLQRLGIAPVFKAKNPFSFMDLQDVQELTNFFERRVSAYQSAVQGEVGFGEDF